MPRWGRRLQAQARQSSSRRQLEPVLGAPSVAPAQTCPFHTRTYNAMEQRGRTARMPMVVERVDLVAWYLVAWGLQVAL